MALFTQPNVLTEVRESHSHSETAEGVSNINYLVDWLCQPPRYTTFRINKLQSVFKVETLLEALKEQSKEMNIPEVPQCYYLKQDCLIVNRWPSYPPSTSIYKEVIVDAPCGAAVLRGAHVYAPGVLGMPANLEEDDVVNIYADVEGKCKRGLKICFPGRKLLVGVGRVKQLRAQLFADNLQPSGIAVEVIMPASRLPVINERIADTGQILLQNLPSIVCGWVLNPRPHERILDMCAAPGNKTTHLAELANNDAFIIALDKTASKVEKIKQRCKEHGATCVQSFVQDSTKCYSKESGSIVNGPPFPADCFDKILLDAPCSALGQRPQLINKITVKVLQSYKFLQKKLFTTAVTLLKPGGCLVYSTCTVSAQENEELVAWALRRHPALELAAAEPLLGGPGWAGCGLGDQERLLVQRFGPEDDPLRRVDDIYRDTVGFFIAKFVKK